MSVPGQRSGLDPLCLRRQARGDEALGELWSFSEAPCWDPWDPRRCLLLCRVCPDPAIESGPTRGNIAVRCVQPIHGVLRHERAFYAMKGRSKRLNRKACRCKQTALWKA